MKNWWSSSSLRVSLYYALSGALWILLSDRLVAFLFPDPVQLSIAQTYKGWFYILITSLLLFQLIQNNLALQKRVEQDHSGLFENSEEGIFRSSPEGRFNLVNPAMARLYGYASPSEMIELVTDIASQIHASAESRTLFMQKLHDAGTVWKFEARNLRKDGSIFWTSTNARVVNDASGNPLYFEGFVTDITAQREADESVELSEARYHMLVEQASDGIFISDSSGRFTEVNQRACAMLGYSRAELLSLSMDQLISPEELALRPLKFPGLSIGGTLISERALTQKNGLLLAIELSTKKLPDGNLISIARDISGRKLMRETMARSELRFRALIENSMDAIALYAPDGRILFESPAANRILGYPLVERIGKNAIDFILEEDRGFAIQELQQLVSEPGRSTRAEVRASHKDGSFRWLEVFATNRLQEPGIEAIVANYRDVTERRQAETALRKAEERYRSLVEKLPAVVFMDIFNDPNTTQYMSPRMKDLLGYTPDEWSLSDDMWENSLHPEDRERVLTEDIRTNESVEPFRIEYRLRHRDGHYVWIKEEASVIRDENGNPQYWQGILLDITERKLAEHSLQRQLKELTVLHAIAQAASSANSMDELIQRVTDIIGETLYSDNCGILLLDEAGRMLQPHPSYRGAGPESLASSFPITQGIVGRSVAARQSIRVGDVTTDPDYVEVTAGIHSQLCVPILNASKTFGALNVESKQYDAFTSDDERFLSTITGGLGTAIERLRLSELEQKRLRQAENLREATAALTSSMEPQELFLIILDAMYRLVPYFSASIELIENDYVEIVAQRGIPEKNHIVGTRYPYDSNKLTVELWEPVIIADVQADERFTKFPGMEYIRGWLGIPLIAQGRRIGFLNLDSDRPNAFTQEDASLVRTFGNQAAVAIEKARLYSETRQRLEELEVVSRISFALRAAKHTSEMFPILLNEIKTNINTDTAAIWIYDQEKSELMPRATSGWLGELPKPSFKPDEGIVGRVFASGRMHISSEFFDDPTAHPANAHKLGKGWGGITVPLRTASETIGAMTIAVQRPRQVEWHHVRLVTTIAEIAGNAIYRSNLYERSEEQIRRLTALREMDAAITSSLDLRITLGILTEHLTSRMGVSAAAILVFNHQSQMLDYYAATGFQDNDLLRASIGVGDGPAGQILLNRRAVMIRDLNDEPQDGFASGEKFSSYYAMPLFSKGSTKGILEAYFREPFSPSSDWLDFLHTLAGQATIAIDNAHLFENLQRTNQDLSLAYDTTLEGWGKALELRDKETQGHTRRVTNLTLELARQMGIPESELTNIRRGSLLHDIGKMGVPDNILHKEGPLNRHELNEMRKHPQYAYDLLYPISYLRSAIDIAYCHHEWWDGSGYPRKLKGEEIPLAARIFAVVDVWDALLSNRPYRRAWTHKKTLEYIRGLSGKQFDPNVVAVFMGMINLKKASKKEKTTVRQKKAPERSSTKKVRRS